MKDYKDIVQNEKQFKPRLFIYPNVEQSQTVFDMDDLSEENFLLLCIKANPEEDLEDQLYLWKGPDFEAQEEEGALDPSVE